MLGDWLLHTVRNLRAHKLRFALTSAGIVWGVALLCVLSGLTDGYDRHYQGEIEKVGPKVVFVFAGGESKQRVGARGAREIEFESPDIAALPALRRVERAAANQSLGSHIFRAEGRTKLLWTFAASGHTLAIRNFEAAQGRLLNDHDVESGARVVFLGAEAARRLFGRKRAVGRTVQIESVPFQVVGVSQEKGDQLVHVNGRDDQLAFVPTTAATRWISREDEFRVLIYAPESREVSVASQADVRQVLAGRLGFRADSQTALGFFNIQEALDIIRSLGFGLRAFFSAAGIITLLVGAIGVMNIMLVVVGERRKEIGLRKAVGATSRSIFAQFLGETLVVTLVSGFLGLALGFGIMAWMSAAADTEVERISRPVFELGTALVIAAIIALVGLVAGVLPAVRAARVDPAISLRAS